MKRLLALLLLIPIAILVVALAVANRDSVLLSLPSTLGYEPFSIPLFALLFTTLVLGMFLGSFITWFNQGKFRKQARVNDREVKKMTTEAEKQRQRADEMASEMADEPSPEQKAFSALGLPAPQKAV